jgi:Zn-dependent protease with chaperone function
MNFYKAQDQARKQTRLLVVLFVLAVSALVFITNICVALFVLYSNPEFSLSAHNDPSFNTKNIFDWFQQLAIALGWKKSLWTTLLVFGVILMAMGFKWLSLRQGGRVVAESLGGVLIHPASKDNLERRLLNVVEEIALASGISVPQIYVLKNELGINAFAAGLTAEDAVIGVTKGALLHFNREQLQGVIAHEFSHILNGDMRLNMKLVAVLHGILMIAEGGYFFMRLGSSNRRGRYALGAISSSDRRDNSVGSLFFIFGLSLWLIGLLGQLFGALIKAAVSRQREYLADASAVQFTRNPEGIAQALSIIGGASYQSKLEHHAAHELSHLFFSNANSLETKSSLFHPSRWLLFATHPPLGDRIKRIQPKWSGRFIKQDINVEALNPYTSPDPAYPSFAEIQAKGLSDAASAISSSTGAVLDSTVLDSTVLDSAGVGGVEAKSAVSDADYQYVEFEPATQNVAVNDAYQRGIFKELVGLAREPFEASLIIVSLLFSDKSDEKKVQLKFIEEAYPKSSDSRIRTIDSLKPKLEQLGTKQTLDLIDIALPSLKLMSLAQYKTEKALLTQLIQADGKVDVFEWLMFQLIKQHLDRHFGLSRPLKPQYKNMKSLAPMFEIVLSRVVHYGFEDKQEDMVDEQDKRLAFVRACDTAGIQGIKLQELKKCDGKVFSQSVHRLSLAYPLLKPRIIKSLLTAIHFDGEVTDKERYIITAIAAVMDCPLLGLEQEIASS